MTTNTIADASGIAETDDARKAVADVTNRVMIIVRAVQLPIIDDKTLVTTGAREALHLIVDVTKTVAIVTTSVRIVEDLFIDAKLLLTGVRTVERRATILVTALAARGLPMNDAETTIGPERETNARGMAAIAVSIVMSVTWKDAGDRPSDEQRDERYDDDHEGRLWPRYMSSSSSEYYGDTEEDSYDDSYRRGRDWTDDDDRDDHQDDRSSEHSHDEDDNSSDDRSYRRGGSTHRRDDEGGRRGRSRDERRVWNSDDEMTSESDNESRHRMEHRAPLASQQESFAIARGDAPSDATQPRERPNLASTGTLAAASNSVAHDDGSSTVLKYQEPAEARAPPAREQWRLFVFKDGEVTDEIALSIKSCWLVGRNSRVVDVLAPNPTVSKQHAVIQFRLVEKRNRYGDTVGETKPYLVDLESGGGTFLNGKLVPKGRYIELRSQDLLMFASSKREYVIMLAPNDD
ncbi:hypothetical protein CDD80_7540 [Ophiocordyceps camponoti-rufipedis]|uniref:FHA domain-containing protein n=1 Tax=Ophiocordyceps camponoti-rufipedis TaxID=2004952 RepID=A0A2C5XQI9_9HYPO|nr:hypothetical protein CDD80_7540 [Ophiocordyceps camponoti-rufipedis]